MSLADTRGLGLVREPAGFQEFVASRRDHLVRAAWLLTGDLADAEDLVQVTLLKVWPLWSRIAAGEGDLDAYVRRALTRCYLTALRRRRWREMLHAGDERPAAAPPPLRWRRQSRTGIWLRALWRCCRPGSGSP